MKDRSDESDPEPTPTTQPAPLPTRHTATKEDLELYILVLAHVREQPQYHQLCSKNSEFFMNTMSKAKEGAGIDLYWKGVNDLGHIVVDFDTAEERDTFIKHSRSWLPSGYRCEHRLYEVEVAIKDSMRFEYLVRALKTPRGKRCAANQLIVDNDAAEGESPRSHLWDLDWAISTKARLESGTTKSLTSTVYGTLVLSLATILQDLRFCGVECAARIRWPRLHLLQCLQCGKLGHCQEICNQGDRCLRCSSSEHEADTCDCDTPCCILCGGDHHSTETNCDTKRRAMGSINHMRQLHYTHAGAHDGSSERRIYRR